MARMRGRSRVSVRQVRRKFVWARTTHQFQNQAADATVTGNMLEEFEQALGSNLIGSTIVRVRGVLTMNSNQTPDSIILAAQVEPANLSAVPADVNQRGPVHSPFSDWMLFEPFMMNFGGGADTSARVIDSKASRKLEEVDEQFSWYLSTSGGNTEGVSGAFYLSIGIKLP